MRSARAVFAVVLWLASAGPAAAITEIVFWHSMTGTLREKVEALAARFNELQQQRDGAQRSMPSLGNARVYWSHSDYRVVPVYKGNYDEALAALKTAAVSGATPHVIQIYDVGTADMMTAIAGKDGHPLVKPIHEVMAIGGQVVNTGSYLPAVVGYYADNQGRLLSLPFNSSTPALYINRELFRRAGLDPDRPPRTWHEMALAAARLKVAGTPCVYTTGWQSWVHLENTAALHDQPFSDASNGYAGAAKHLLLDTPFFIRHIAMLADWQRKGWFSYYGRKDDGEPPFYKGECAMLTDSTSAYGDIARNARFEFAISPLPHHADVRGAPRNTLIGGASLWVTRGKTLEEYKGVARFLNFLSQREVQAEWHQQTGYLPISQAAYDLSRSQGFYERQPGLELPLQAMMARPQTVASRGIRLRHFVTIRGVIDEELEAVWRQEKTPRQALSAIVSRGDATLRR